VSRCAGRTSVSVKGDVDVVGAGQGSCSRGARRNPKPSGSVSRTPSENKQAALLARDRRISRSALLAHPEDGHVELLAIFVSSVTPMSFSVESSTTGGAAWPSTVACYPWRAPARPVRAHRGFSWPLLLSVSTIRPSSHARCRHWQGGLRNTFKLLRFRPRSERDSLSTLVRSRDE